MPNTVKLDAAQFPLTKSYLPSDEQRFDMSSLKLCANGTKQNESGHNDRLDSAHSPGMLTIVSHQDMEIYTSVQLDKHKISCAYQMTIISDGYIS